MKVTNYNHDKKIRTPKKSLTGVTEKSPVLEIPRQDLVDLEDISFQQESLDDKQLQQKPEEKNKESNEIEKRVRFSRLKKTFNTGLYAICSIVALGAGFYGAASPALASPAQPAQVMEVMPASTEINNGSFYLQNGKLKGTINSQTATLNITHQDGKVLLTGPSEKLLVGPETDSIKLELKEGSFKGVWGNKEAEFNLSAAEKSLMPETNMRELTGKTADGKLISFTIYSRQTDNILK